MTGAIRSASSSLEQSLYLVIMPSVRKLSSKVLIWRILQDFKEKSAKKSGHARLSGRVNENTRPPKIPPNNKLA